MITVQVVWSYRRTFLLVTCFTFAVLSVGILTLLKRTSTVRSSIEIGSAVVGDKQEAFESPEYIAKRISSVLGPAALLIMAKEGTSPSILSALQNPRVESIGRSVVVTNTVDPGLESEAKQFQEITANRLIEELAQRAHALREAINVRISLAKEAFDDLQRQIKIHEVEISRISALIDDSQTQLEKQRADLARLYQRMGTALQPAESSPIEAQIRELREQISSQSNLIGRLILDRSDLTHSLTATRHLFATQSTTIADAQFEQNSFNETRISLPPSLMPAPTSSIRPSLFLVALAMAILVSFGIVVLLHNARQKYSTEMVDKAP
jgi:hypothetical protein